MPEVRLTVREGAAAGAELPLEGELTLGRDPSSGFEIDDPGVSRRHAAVRIIGDEARIEDVGSANGTYVNGERIEASTALADGDVIQLGSTVFDVKVDARSW